MQQDPWQATCRSKGHQTVGMHGGPNGPLGVADHRPPAPSGHTQAISGCRACAASTGRILVVGLLNGSNTRHSTASVRAWLFAVSQLSVADVLKYGAQEQAWRDVYRTRRPIHVHALCSWKPLLRNWANLHKQQDASAREDRKFFKAAGNHAL